MSNVPQWGPWTPWCPFSANCPPHDAPRGATVQADLRVRPNLIGRCRQPFYVNSHVFTVREGEAFLLRPPAPPTSTHLVTRYRVQRDGETRPSEELSEEELLQELTTAFAEQEAHKSEGVAE